MSKQLDDNKLKELKNFDYSHETFKDRLVRFARVRYNKGMNTFESYCGISRGTINNIGKGVSTTTLTPIVEKCPDLNVRWLLTGEGDMVNRNAEEELQHYREQLERAKTIIDNQKKTLERIKKLELMLEQQREHIDTLNGYIKVLNEQMQDDTIE